MKKRRKAILLRSAAFFLLVFVLFVAAIFFSRSERFAVKEFSTAAESPILAEEITKVLEAAAERYYWHMFSASNFLLYPKNRVTEEVLARFKEVKGLKLESPNIHMLVAVPVFRTPVATWCGEARSGGSALEEACYFLDADGFVYAAAPAFSGDVYVRYYGPLGGEGPVGAHYEQELFKNLHGFLARLKALGVRPMSVFMNGERDMVIGAVGGANILLNEKSNLDNAFSNLDTLLRSESLTTEGGLKDDLEYIDLRFGNKVFYKLKNEEKTPSTSLSAPFAHAM